MGSHFQKQNLTECKILYASKFPYVEVTHSNYSRYRVQRFEKVTLYLESLLISK